MLSFAVQTAAQPTPLELHDPFVMVCGFSGREASEVWAHTQELAELGIVAPARTPSFMPMPSHLLVIPGRAIEVVSADTSGEAAPVLLGTAGGDRYVTVGSDHTDRALEVASILAGKASCPKLLSSDAWPLEDVRGHWDQLVLSSSVRGAEAHQQGTLAALKRPDELRAAMDDVVRIPTGRPLVMFLGTLAGSGSVPRGTSSFVARIEDRVRDRFLECSYAVEDISIPHETVMSS